MRLQPPRSAPAGHLDPFRGAQEQVQALLVHALEVQEADGLRAALHERELRQHPLRAGVPEEAHGGHAVWRLRT